jgi:peptide/nickel transport system permease protein
VQRFILMRVLQAMLSLFILSIIIFLLVRLTGDPVLLLLPPDASQAAVDDLRHALGLDKNLATQYWIFASDFVQGDFGESLKGKKPVIDLVKDRMPFSFKLAAVATAMSLIISIPLGVLAAVKKGTVFDTAATFISVVGQAVPSFWLGILMMQLFTVKLGWLPSSGAGEGVFAWQHYMMPAITMAFWATAGLTRLLRSGMLEVMDSEYIKLARIKGVSETSVIWKHALRNSLVSVITFGAIYVAAIITLGTVVEVVFAWPGLGRLLFDGIVFRDFPVIQTVVLLSAGLVILVNLFVDIAYAYLDPRIRYAQ